MPRIAPGVIPIKEQNPYQTIRVISRSEEPIQKNDILVVSGFTGDVMIVQKADATNKPHEQAQLYIAKNTASAGKALWVQPWCVATQVDTESWPCHTPVYLGEQGKFVFELPYDNPMWYKRRIGTVIDKGVIHFNLR